MTFLATQTSPTRSPIENLPKPTERNCENAPTDHVSEIRLRYVADLAACDPEDACLFCAMGEVIARRLHGKA